VIKSALKYEMSWTKLAERSDDVDVGR